MKSIEEITEIIMNHGGYKLIISKYPTWISKDKNEGCHIEAGILKAFRIDNMSRIFDEPVTDYWQNIVDECGAKQVKVKPEQTAAMELERPTRIPEGIGIVPDTFTPELMEKWKKKTTFERMLMFQNTPKQDIETMPKTGYKYIKGNKMIQELNIAFLFNWSSYIDEVKETETGYWVRGYITVEADNCSITRSAIGIADKHKGATSEDVAKAACMDMIKKAASTLGFNGDIYRGEL